MKKRWRAWVKLLNSGEEVLDFVGRKVRTNDVTAMIPHFGNISKERLPRDLTSDDVLDVVLYAWIDN